MYLSSTITVDPSQETLIDKIKPTKVFSRVLDFLTAGLATEKEEVETFTALAILQQINRAARAMGMTNIVRLSKDDFDFYLDEAGKTDDLKDAMDTFQLETDDFEGEVFKTLSLVLEHEDDKLKYLVEIDISRKHRVKEHPITIKLNGLMKNLKKEQNESIEDFKRKQEKTFASQEAYEAVVHEAKTHFDSFNEKLEFELRKAIKVDDIKTETKAKIIRPRERITDPAKVRSVRDGGAGEPLFYGYYGFDMYLFSSLLWVDMMYQHNIYCHDLAIVDAEGHDVMQVGNEGFYSADSDTLNVDGDFGPPDGGDVEYYGDNDFESEIEEAGLGWEGGDDGGDADSSSFFSFGDSDSSGGDSGSSCSSCGGCGGE